MDTKSIICGHCRRRCLAQRQKRNEFFHTFNWVVILLTCGVWLLAYIPLAILVPSSAWVCSQCGSEE